MALISVFHPLLKISFPEKVFKSGVNFLPGRMYGNAEEKEERIINVPID